MLKFEQQPPGGRIELEISRHMTHLKNREILQILALIINELQRLTQEV